MQLEAAKEGVILIQNKNPKKGLSLHRFTLEKENRKTG
jgi:hypothetical protein